MFSDHPKLRTKVDTLSTATEVDGPSTGPQVDAPWFSAVAADVIADKSSATHGGGGLHPLRASQVPAHSSAANLPKREIPSNAFMAGAADPLKAVSPVAPSNPVPAVHERKASECSSNEGVAEDTETPLSPVRSPPDGEGATYACIQLSRYSPGCDGFTAVARGQPPLRLPSISPSSGPAATKPKNQKKMQRPRSPPFPSDLHALFVHPVSEYDLSNTDPHLLAALNACHFVSLPDISAVMSTLTHIAVRL